MQPPPPPPQIATTETAAIQSPRRLIRILFLTYYASLGSLLPYLPVYYHSLGHGGLIIGMLGAVKPSTTFLVAPFWGILSDRSSNRFSILYFTFVVSLISQLLMAVRKDVPFLVAMVFITAFFNAPVKSLIDSLVMDNLDNKADYGRLRLWGQLGFGIGSSGVGVLLSKYLKGGGASPSRIEWGTFAGPALLEPLAKALYKLWMSITGYRLLFLAHAALSVPTLVCMRAFDKLEQQKEAAAKKAALLSLSEGGQEEAGKEPSPSLKKKARIGEGISLLLHNSDALLFFFLVFVVGTSSGIVENFAHVRIGEVGGGGREMGLSRLVSSLAGAPMFWFSGPLTELIGADRVLVVSLLSYVTRFLIYASMRHPYHGLPAEALRGVTFAAFWSTGTIYAHRISPHGMSSTMVRSTHAHALLCSVFCFLMPSFANMICILV